MSLAAGLALLFATTVVMEVVAYATHRFLMHGPAWGWHRSHHEERTGIFEKNDLFGAIFAVLALGLIVLGASSKSQIYWIGLGMTLYGVLYALLHDGLVHRRWPFRHKPKRAYLKRLVQAHRLHHAVHGRDGCVSFGFLYAPPIERLLGRLRMTNPGSLGQRGR